MHIGTVLTGQASSPGQSSAIGSVNAWSTFISWQVVMSKSLSIGFSMIAHDSAVWPCWVGKGGRPQPSSALLYSPAAPTAKVGILSRKKLSPWSL